MRKILLCAVLTVFLQGCIPAAFVAGATAGGAVIYDNRSTKVIFEDRDITYQAQKRFNDNEGLREKAHVSVATFNHIVLLVGQVPTEEMRNSAEDVVKSIPKVKLIHNEITVENPISQVARTNDTWLTTKVRTALLAEKGLNSAQIKVVTENSIVYLMGLTSRGQAEQATEVVRQIAGVRKVVKIFEYMG